MRIKVDVLTGSGFRFVTGTSTPVNHNKISLLTSGKVFKLGELYLKQVKLNLVMLTETYPDHKM